MEASQMTLDGQQPLINGTNGFGAHGHGHTFVDEGDDGSADMADPNAQLERESERAGARMSVGSAGGLVNGQDVEMS
jgi:hypothetical protein